MIIKDSVLGRWYVEVAFKSYNVYEDGKPTKIVHRAPNLQEAVGHIFELRVAELTGEGTLKEFNQTIFDMNEAFQNAFKINEVQPVAKYQEMIPKVQAESTGV